MNTSKNSTKFCGETKIYHYMSFQRLANLLIKKENTLVSPLKWEDPFEKWRLDELKKISKEKGDDFDCNERYWFGQCWTTNTKSDAMWKIYTKGTDGFRIRSTVSKLWNSLPSEKEGVEPRYRIAKVSYRQKKTLKREIRMKNKNFDSDKFRSETIDNETQFGNISAAFMIKRLAYEYEKEVRLICHWNRENDDGLFSYDIGCPKDLIEQILIHPKVSQKDYLLLKCVLEKILKNNILEEIEIKRSKLHDLGLESVEHK